MVSNSVIILAVAIASAVEMVEAFTILLAVATTKGWRTSIAGGLTALVVLSLLVGTAGQALVHFVPINILRTVVGIVILIFGLQWLKKAIMRSSGLKAMHDEDAIYEREVKTLNATEPTSTSSLAGLNLDSTGFVVAFKGAFLEGLEVVIIVLSLGSSSRYLLPASITAIATAIVIFVLGAALSKQFSKVPENKMKMTVGIMLVSFGTFWTAEGLRANWPFSDLSIVGLVAIYSLACFAIVELASRRTLGNQSRPGTALG